jgi:hypothetical protein
MTTWIDGYPQPVTEILEEVVEIETHLHSRERWFGLAALPSGETHVADLDTIAPFEVSDLRFRRYARDSRNG